MENSVLKLRYSALETLCGADGCPWRFYQQYIAGRPEKDTPQKDIGNAAHKVLYRWHTSCGECDLELAAWQEAMKYKTLRNEENPAKVVQEILIMCRVFLKNYDPGPEGGELHLEEKISVKFGPDKIFTGTPDFLKVYPDKTAILLDYKTGRLRQDNTMQKKVYAWLGSLHYGYKHCTAQKHYLRRNEVDEPEVYGPEDLASAGLWVQDSFRNALARLKKGPDGFEPVPGRFCRACSFSIDCPAVDIKKTVINLDQTSVWQTAQLKKMGEEYLVLEGRLKQLQKMLKDSIKNSGALRVNGVVFDNYESDTGKTVDDLEAFCRLMLEQGLSPWEYLRIDANVFKKLDISYVPGLDDLIIEKPGRRAFTWKAC